MGWHGSKGHTVHLKFYKFITGGACSRASVNGMCFVATCWSQANRSPTIASSTAQTLGKQVALTQWEATLHFSLGAQPTLSASSSAISCASLMSFARRSASTCTMERTIDVGSLILRLVSEGRMCGAAALSQRSYHSVCPSCWPPPLLLPK